MALPARALPPWAARHPAPPRPCALPPWAAWQARGFVLPHFVGCTSNSTEPVQIVRRLLEELKRAFELEGEVPYDDNECLAM
eukprot:5588718-Prymnesium_polylepis.1